MSSKIILMAETGSDLPAPLAEELGIHLVPMHVSLGEITRDDGTFPAEDICAYYDRTGKAPTTSGSTPDDFIRAFDAVHAACPDSKILHLAYSAVTTCSFHSAQLAAEGRDYIASVDTKQVSAGQAAVVLAVARHLKENPDLSLEEAARFARQTAEKVQMAFLPKNLDYLRAGGRVSNVVALTGNLLGLHPCIEVLDGYLMAKKKYRGALEKVIPKLVRDHAEKYDLKRDHVYLIWAPGFTEGQKAIAEQAVWDCGFQSFTWLKTGCVITCHGGYGAFGMVGFRP